MENFLISAFCGLIFAVDILAAHFGWNFAKRFRSFGWAAELFLTAVMYKLAVAMACCVTDYLGASNDPLVETLLLVPILCAIFAAVVCSVTENKKDKARRHI